MNEAVKTFTERGDLAHVALLLWASGASSLLIWSMQQLAKVNERFARFTSEIARFNRLVGGSAAAGQS